MAPLYRPSSPIGRGRGKGDCGEERRVKGEGQAERTGKRVEGEEKLEREEGRGRGRLNRVKEEEREKR